LTAHAAGGPEDAAPPAQGRGRALATVCGVLFLTFLDTTIMSVALADVQDKLHAGVSQMQWVVNSYALVFAAFMLAAGTLGDRVGRKKVMLGGVVIFAGGSLVGALAPTTAVLIAGRGIMGIGAAACEPGTLSIIRHLYPDRRARARALGVWSAVAGLALAMGPVFGGLLTGGGGWRAIFWFNLAAGLVALTAAWLVLPESADPEGSGFDVPGYLLGPAAIGTIVFAIILGETMGYSAPAIIALFAIGAAASVAFVVAEARSRSPMLDMKYVRKPPFAGSLIVAFAAYFGVFSIFFLTALYLQVVIGYSPYRIAALFGPMAAAMILASALAGRWVARVGPRAPVAFGAIAAAAGVLLTNIALTGSIHFAFLALSLTLAGLGFGVVVVPVTSVALSVVPAARSGMAASATTTARELGAVIGVAVLGSLFNNQLIEDLTRRLIQLDVPPPFRDVVINAVLTGSVPSGGQGPASAQAKYGSIVNRVVSAAYGAFHTGLSVSLTVAGLVILASGFVAWVTFSPRQYEVDVECLEQHC
jgi:EmrB/QacA subfamily drug resistance transporter